MTNHQYVKVERTLLKRGVTDFERKLKAAAASGALGYALVVVLAAFGIKLPPEVAELIPVGIAILGGYTVHSSAVTTTFTGSAGDGSTSVRVGPVGTPVGEPKALTGAIPVPAYVDPAPAEPFPHPKPAPAAPVPEPPADPVPYEVPDSAPPADVYPVDAVTQAFTSVIDPDTSARAQSWATKYLPTPAAPAADQPYGN